jgi:DNA-binding LacI/PurR family transcriptional regulator
VPEDESVTGFDGVRAAFEAGLTTVQQPVIDKGMRVGRLLFDPAVHSRPRRVMLSTTFVRGKTTAPPRM